MASPFWVVARTEYLEGARTRWFLISTLLGPLLLGGLMVLPAYLQVRGAGRATRLAIVDHGSGRIGQAVRTVLTSRRGDEPARFQVEMPTGNGGDETAFIRRVEAGELEGVLVLPPDVVEGGEVVYRGVNASSQIDMAMLHRGLQAAVQRVRAEARGLKDKEVQALLRPVSFTARQANGEGASGMAVFAVAYGVAMLLYMAILLYAVAVMRSVLQEKMNRVLEVVVACARPRDLLLGKVLGVGSLGLTQLGIWLAVATYLAVRRGPILERFGIHGTGSVVLPSMGPGAMLAIALYFVGGYFLYAAIFAAIGAANNTQQEAQQAQMPVTMLLVGAILCFPVITSAPRDSAAVALTLVPFFSPVLMPMRVMLTPVPWWQLGLSVAILALTIGLVMAAAARIYRVGILMYGKRPSPGELLRWIRED